jgi:hypothetical protein
LRAAFLAALALTAAASFGLESALVLGAIGIELADRLTFDAPLRETKAKIGFVVDLWFC